MVPDLIREEKGKIIFPFFVELYQDIHRVGGTIAEKRICEGRKAHWGLIHFIYYPPASFSRGCSQASVSNDTICAANTLALFQRERAANVNMFPDTRYLAADGEGFERVGAHPALEVLVLEGLYEGGVEAALDRRHLHQDHVLVFVRQRRPQHSMTASVWRYYQFMM